MSFFIQCFFLLVCTLFKKIVTSSFDCFVCLSILINISLKINFALFKNIYIFSYVNLYRIEKIYSSCSEKGMFIDPSGGAPVL